MERISVTMACDLNYAQHTIVVAKSILEHTSSPVDFYILGDKLPQELKQSMADAIESSISHVVFYDMDKFLSDDMYTSDHISKAAYFRLAIGNIIPPTVKKIIYLDVDLVVCKDISILWSVDLKGKVIGAVPDYGILSSRKSLKEKEKSFGWKPSQGYFNSGVLVIDLNKWRKGAYGDLVLTAAKEKSFRHHDQDALNAVLGNSWEALDISWNVIPPVYMMKFSILFSKELRKNALRAVKDISILHWAGRRKPWQYKPYKPFNGIYYKYEMNRDNGKPEYPCRKKIAFKVRSFLLHIMC